MDRGLGGGPRRRRGHRAARGASGRPGLAGRGTRRRRPGPGAGLAEPVVRPGQPHPDGRRRRRRDAARTPLLGGAGRPGCRREADPAGVRGAPAARRSPQCGRARGAHVPRHRGGRVHRRARRRRVVLDLGLLDADRVGPPWLAHNQSVYGVLTRLLGESPSTLLWLGITLPLGGAALLLAAAWWRRGDRLLGTGLAGLAMLLASPVSWSHHWVWAVPVAIALWPHARGLAAAWTAVFVARPVLWPPWGERRELAWGFLDHLAGNGYVLAAVGSWSGRPHAWVRSAVRRAAPAPPGRCRAAGRTAARTRSSTPIRTAAGGG